MLVIFDFDGTLADTWHLFVREWPTGAQKFRLKQLDRREMEGLRGLETKEVFRALGVPWWRLPAVVSYLRRRAADLAGEIRLFPGMSELVVALSDAGHTLAVVSTNAEETVRTVLGPELSARFRYFACRSSIFGKAAKFRKLLRRSGLPATAIIAVGDETRDLDAAHKAGIAAIAVEWGYNDSEILRRMAPGRTAASAEQLRQMLTLYDQSGRL